MNDQFDPEVESRVSAAFARAPLVAAPAALRDAIAADRVRDVPRARTAGHDRIPRPFAALVGIAAAIVVVAGTAAYFVTRPADSGGHGGQPAVATATSPDGLKLTMKVARTQVRTGEVIQATATLVYEGPNESITVGGSGADGVVYFGVRQLDGKLEMAPVQRQSCGSYTFKRGAEATFPFQKSGGYLGQDTPQDRFAQQYLSTKELTLPAGRWEVYAELNYDVRECGGQQRDVKAPVTILVGSDAAPAVSATPAAPDKPAQASATTADGITITISSPRSHYAAGEPIPLTGTIRYDGPNASLTAYGSGMGIATFGFTRPGSGVEYVPAVTADCSPHELVRSAETTLKLGGYSPSGQTSDDAFIREHDAPGLPGLALPAGTWDVFVETNYATEPCSAGVSFVQERATIRLTIGETAPAIPPVSIAPAPMTTPTAPAASTATAAGLRATQTVTTSDGIELTISTPKTSYSPTEAITITTTTRYAGPDGTFKLTRSGSGLVAFEVRQFDGPLDSGYSQTADCRQETLVRGAVTTIPFAKSGAYLNDGSPEDNFRFAYLARPDLVLPAGRWEIVAHLLYGDASCSVASRDEMASVVVDVR